MGGLSIWHWLIVLVVVVLIFGTKKLRNIGQDLGGAVKGFKEGMKTPEDARRDDGERCAADRAADSRQDDRRRSEEGNEQAVDGRQNGVRKSGVRLEFPRTSCGTRARKFESDPIFAPFVHPCSISASPNSSSSPSSR